MDKYICWDGVDMEFSSHKTKREAIRKLNDLIANGLEGDEWMDGVEDSFVAVIINEIDKVESEPVERFDDETKFYDMNIIEVD